MTINSFYVDPGSDYSQGLAGLGQALQQYGQVKQQRQKQDEARQRLMEGGKALQAALDSGNADEVANVSAQYPDLANTAMALHKFKSEATKENMLQGMRRVLSGEDPNAIFEERVKKIYEEGGDPTHTVKEWQRYREDPEGSFNEIKNTYALYDQAGYKALFGSDKKSNLARQLEEAGFEPGTPEFTRKMVEMMKKPSGTTVNIGPQGAIAADEFTGAFGDSGEGKRLEIQARALARKEDLSAQEAIERTALQKDVSQSERTADTYYQRMVGATKDIESMEDKGYNPSAGDSILSQFPGGNFLVGDDYQKYEASAREWIRAKLRKESGAEIPPREMQGEFETYFYVPGDSQATIKQKRALRARAELAMAGERTRLGPKEQGSQPAAEGSRDRSLDEILSQYGVQ